MSELTLKVGHTYRAKKPRPAGSAFEPFYNDRTILWLGQLAVQYDGPAVPNGRHYPRTSRERFLAWAGEDVTEKLARECPESYQEWDR